MKHFCRLMAALLLTTVYARAVPVTLRVVDAQGAPVGGVPVEIIDYADVADDKPTVPRLAKTAADGTISLDLRGVPERKNETVFAFRARGQQAFGNARVRDPKLGYGILALTAGENELALQQTVRVAGTIRNAAGAPLAGARVRLLSIEKSEQDSTDYRARYGQAPVAVVTKADGTWEFGALPRGYAEFAVEAPGSADDEVRFQIDNSPTRAPDLRLRDAGLVRGRILDFAGKPVTRAYAFLDNDYSSIADTDAQGRFELSGVPVGESKLRFYSMAPNWTDVSGEYKTTIPAQGAVVDIGDVRTDEGLLLTGRVVDDVTKAPLAGVQLKLFNNAILQTDAQGHFEMRVSKPYYGLNVMGDYTEKNVSASEPQNGDKFDVGTIEVERIGATFSGRVTDENGVAVAGARVGLNRTNQFELVITDNQGNFKIENLPYKPLAISASDGARFNSATATPGVAIDLKLSPATAPLSDAQIEKLWEQLKIRRISDLGRYSEALGARRVFETARRFDAATNPTQIGQGLDDYLSDRARGARTPAEREAVAREGVELLRQFDPNTWSLGMGEIAMLAAQTGDDELRAFAARWYDAQKSRVRPPDSPDKLEWYHSALTERVMSVGAALERPDAEKYRDIWLGQIDKPHSENLRQYLPEWGETLWLAEPKWFDEIVGAWPASERMSAIVGALKVEQNAAQAKALLARLEKLASDPAIEGADADAAKTDSMSPISQSAQNLYEGRTNYARSMALVDAPAALYALDQVQAVIQSADTYQIAATIARAAIASGQTEIARRALKFGLSDRDAEGSGALAMIARPFDAQLSAQLMEVARKNALRTNEPFEPAGWADVAAYAVALRDLDASAGRLLLEDQWAGRGQQNIKFPIPDEEYNKRKIIRAQEKMAWAMAFYDVGRALQWLSEIKDDRNQWNNGLERTRLAILVAALTPPSRRSFLLGATYFN